MPLILDANVMFAIAAREGGLGPFGDEELVGPPLLWPETRSALHVARRRGLISEATAYQALEVLESDRVRERRHPRLGRQAWRIADKAGWLKTYDAEYLALAYLIDAPLVTLDRRMHTAAGSVGVTAQAPPA